MRALAALSLVFLAAWTPEPNLLLPPQESAPLDEPPPQADVSNVIYLNRCVGGCTITRGPRNNSTTDTSWFPNGANGTVYNITEFSHDDATWNALLACVQDLYSYYDVVVTDVDPGTAPHTEVYCAGLSEEIGENAGGLGGPISESTTVDIACTAAENNIAFAFLNGYPAEQIEYMCGVIAQESGHSFGMPYHVRDCNDPMSYSYSGPCSGGAQRGYFRNRDMRCGDFADESCTCGSNRVNTHKHLEGIFGAGSDPNDEPPTGSILNPVQSQQITENTPYLFTAGGARGIYHAELLLNGWRWAEYDAPDHILAGDNWPPDQLQIPPVNGFPGGVIDVQIALYDDLGNSSLTPTVTGLSGSPCSNADSCLDGQQCEEGKCFWPPATGQLGEDCAYDQACVGSDGFDGKCVGLSNGDSICSRECSTQLAADCGDGFYCEPTNATDGVGLCLPNPEEGGCCSSGRDDRSSLGGMLAMMSLAGLVLFRRRRAH